MKNLKSRSLLKLVTTSYYLISLGSSNEYIGLNDDMPYKNKQEGILSFDLQRIQNHNYGQVLNNLNDIHQNEHRMLQKSGEEGQGPQIKYEPGIGVKNFIDNQYSARFKFGSGNNNYINLLIDTGSSLTWVPGGKEKCPNYQCKGAQYQEDQSVTFKNHTITENVKYGNGQISGHLVNDVISTDQIDPSTPSAKVNFLAAWQVEGMASIQADGILGLSPRILTSKPGMEKRDNMIMKFFENKSIKKPMFSLYFKDDQRHSRMVIGGYDEDKVKAKGNIRGPNDDSSDSSKTEDGIFWMDINSQFYWMVDLYEAKINRQEIDIGDTANIFINSGTSVNYVPEKVLNYVIEQISEPKERTCFLENGLYECSPCNGPDDESYPTIKLRMGSIMKQHWFEMSPRDYMYVDTLGYCIIQFRSVPDKPGVRQRWLLGQVFLRAYDSIYDLENRRLGLVGKGRSLAEEQILDMYPNLFVQEEIQSNSLIPILIVILVVVVCGASICAAKIWYDKRILGEQSKSNERAKSYQMKDDVNVPSESSDRTGSKIPKGQIQEILNGNESNDDSIKVAVMKNQENAIEKLEVGPTDIEMVKQPQKVEDSIDDGMDDLPDDDAKAANLVLDNKNLYSSQTMKPLKQ